MVANGRDRIITMEENIERKLKCEQCKDKNLSLCEKLEDHRRCQSIHYSDQSEGKSKNSLDSERDEQDSCDPKKSSDISPSHRRALGKKHVCKVCYKEFRSLKAVHGHSRLHSGKKEVEEAKSKEWKAETFYSLRTKKTTKTFDSPRRPGSNSCQNQVLSCNSNGETSTPMSIDPSSSLRSNEASQSFLFDILSHHLEYESDERIGAFNLLMMARGMTEIHQQVKVHSSISESTDGYDQKKACEFSENGSGPSNWMSEKHKPDGESERPISSVESGINLNLSNIKLEADSSEKEEFRRKSKKLRRNSYKCRVCSESFPSYQALGGHSNIHKDGKKRRKN